MTKSLLIRLGWSLVRITTLLLVLVVVAWLASPRARQGGAILWEALKEDRIDDHAKLLAFKEQLQFNWYLGAIDKETGVDINLLFVNLRGKKPIDAYAADEATRRRLGKKSGARGLLIVYDPGSTRLRVELGYGMEGHFSDAFIGRLIEDHTTSFFRSGDISTGLRLLVRIMHERLRDEMLGGSFDATPFATAHFTDYVSGGGGATAPARLGNENTLYELRKLHAGTSELQRFVPQPTVQAAHTAWIDWLRSRTRNPKAALFTPDSRMYLEQLPITEPYYDHMLASIWNEQYDIVERNGHAVLYYTTTPLVSPMFFRRGEGGWQIDLFEEVFSTREMIGGPYTWFLTTDGWPAKVFADLYLNVRGANRIKGGDNRPLPIRTNS